MDYFLLDRLSKNFTPMIHQEHEIIDSSFDILKNTHKINNLILGSTDPYFFFDAVLWSLEHSCFNTHTLVALTTQALSTTEQYIQSCYPIFHVFDGFYSDSHMQNSFIENDLMKLWSDLNQPWQSISAQFAKIYSQTQQPWALGLNTWLYRDSHEEYFKNLNQHMVKNYINNPWTQFFDLYYRDHSNFVQNYYDLSVSPLGPYAKLVITNAWLETARRKSMDLFSQDQVSPIINNLFQFKPHKFSLIEPLLSHLFTTDKYNNIFVHQNFSVLFSSIIKPSYNSTQWFTYQLGRAYIDQSFTECEKLADSFYSQGLILSPFQADMMRYFQESFGAFRGLESIVEHYVSKSAG